MGREPNGLTLYSWVFVPFQSCFWVIFLYVGSLTTDDPDPEVTSTARRGGISIFNFSKAGGALSVVAGVINVAVRHEVAKLRENIFFRLRRTRILLYFFFSEEQKTSIKIPILLFRILELNELLSSFRHME